MRACALPVEFWHLTNCENRCVTLLRNSNTQHWIPLQPPTFGKSSTPHCSWSAGRLTGARPLPAAVATGAAASCAPASWLQGALMLPPATLRTRKSGPGQISPRAVASGEVECSSINNFHNRRGDHAGRYVWPEEVVRARANGFAAPPPASPQLQPACFVCNRKYSKLPS